MKCVCKRSHETVKKRNKQDMEEKEKEREREKDKESFYKNYETFP